MSASLFHGTIVTSRRIIYTPSLFAKANLLHLQETGTLQAQKPHTSKRQNLSSYLFFMVLNGSGTLTYENQTYSLSQGDCIFLDCQKPYSHHTSHELWSLKWVHFYGPNLHEIYRKYRERGGKTCFRSGKNAEYKNLLNAIFTIASSDDPIKDMKICEKLTSLLTLLMEEEHGSLDIRQHSVGKRDLQEVKDYLEQHYFEKITLGGLSELFYINKYYLARLFKTQFGFGINNYLLQLRITHAKQLLRFSDLPIEAIGQKCGMNDANYFSRMFKKIEGITPGEYRLHW